MKMIQFMSIQFKFCSGMDSQIKPITLFYLLSIYGYQWDLLNLTRLLFIQNIIFNYLPMSIFRLAFVLLLPIFTIGEQVPVRVHCLTTSTTQCASQYKLTVSGNGINTQYCLRPGQKCNPSYDVNFSLYNCTVDFKQEQCFNGVCFNLIPNIYFCTNDFTCSDKSDTYKYTCSQCQQLNTMNCPLCFSSFLNGLALNAEGCAGDSCVGLGGQAIIETCTEQTSGIGCSCCMKSYSALPTCTSINTVLSLGAVNNWVKTYKSTSSNTTDTNSSSTSNTTINNSTANTTSNFSITVINSTSSTPSAQQIYEKYLVIFLLIFSILVN